MATPPFFAFPNDEQPAEAEPTNVVPFPASVTAQNKLRHAQRMVERMEEWMLCDPRSPDLSERLQASMAEDGLDDWSRKAAEAQAEVAFWQGDDKLSYRGRVYQAVRSSAGAN